MGRDTLRVVILKPSKYGVEGYVERFHRGFMPNSTVPYLRSMTPILMDGVRIESIAIDEYVRRDLDYLELSCPFTAKTSAGPRTWRWHLL